MLCKSTSCNLLRMVQTPILISRVQCQLKLVKFHHFLHQIKNMYIWPVYQTPRNSVIKRQLQMMRNTILEKCEFYPFSKGWLFYDKKECTSSLKFLLSSLLNIAYIFWQITVAEWSSYNPDKSVLKKLFFSECLIDYISEFQVIL